MKDKEKFLQRLQEKKNLTEQECIVVNSILEDHFVIGHNNKEKIKADFIAKLNMTEEQADALYNQCAELIVTGIFK